MTSQELILTRIEAAIGNDLVFVNDRQYANTGTLRTLNAETLEQVAAVRYDFQDGDCRFGPSSEPVAALWYDEPRSDCHAPWVCGSIPELVNTVVIALRGEL